MRDFKHAYPQPTQAFHAALESACAQIEREVNRPARRLSSRALLIAAMIAVLLISTIAIATRRSNLLEILFWGVAPNKQAESLLQPIGQSVTSEGITLSVDEILVDGDAWHVSYTLSSERDDIVLCSDGWTSSRTPNKPLIEGVFDLMLALGGEGIPKSRTLKLSSEEMYWAGGGRSLEPFELTLLYRVSKPLLTPVVWPVAGVTPESEVAQGELTAKQMAKYAKRGELPIFRVGAVNVENYLKDSEVRLNEGALVACEKAGLAELLTELKLTVTIDPSQVQPTAHMRMREPQQFELDDRTLLIDVVDIAPTKSLVVFRVIPKTADYPFLKYAQYALLDSSGKPLHGSGIYGSFLQDHFLGRAVHYHTDEPLSAIPEQLTIAPVILTSERGGIDETVRFDMDRAVTVQLESAVPTAQAVVANMPDIEEMGRRYFGDMWTEMNPWEYTVIGEAPAVDHDTKRYRSDPYGPYESSDYTIDTSASSGRVDMRKPTEIIHDLNRQIALEQEGIELPYQPGVYTQDEAEQLLRATIRDVLGVDSNLLVTRDSGTNDQQHERASMYDFELIYVYDGMLLTSDQQAGFYGTVTNDGVVYLSGKALAVATP